MTPARADGIIDEYIRERLRVWDTLKLTNPDTYDVWQVSSARQRYEDPTKFENYFSAQRAGWINQLVNGKYTNRFSPEQRLAIKVERAYRQRLLRKDPQRNADYPKDWKIRSTKVRLQDDETCSLCGETWTPGVTDLHVHHIIHKANGGGHNPNNLVTLCHRHHNDEHPEQIFSAVAREPESLCPLPHLHSEFESPQLPISARGPEATTHQTTEDHSTGSKGMTDGSTITEACIEGGVHNYPGLDTKGMAHFEDAAKATAMMRATATPPKSRDAFFVQSAIHSDIPPDIEQPGKRLRLAVISRDPLFTIIACSVLLLLLLLLR